MLTLPANTFRKEERLCGKSNISALISNGKWGGTAHLRYCWRRRDEEDGTNRIMVTVSKKFFKRAVKRNLLKRRMREAYRLQKAALTTPGIDFMVSYNTKEVLDYQVIAKEMASILGKLSQASAAK